MRTIKLSDEDITFSFNCRQPVYELLAENLKCDSLGQYQVERIVITNRGFEFPLPTHFVTHVPDRWSEFVNEHNLGEFVYFGAEGLKIFGKYTEWETSKVLDRAIDDLNGNKVTFAELNVLAPSLKHHPKMQAFATNAVFENNLPLKKGKPRSGTEQPDNVKELIAWVIFYAGKNQLSIENAVAQAIKGHPELIPAEWKEPEDALARAFKRHKQSRNVTIPK